MVVNGYERGIFILHPFKYTAYTTFMRRSDANKSTKPIPRKTSTADSILVAARALLDKEGVSAVAMRSVAERVGITPMAIYRHYTDHASLLNAVADAGFDELATRVRKLHLKGGVEDRLMQVSEVFLDVALRFPNLYELMFLVSREGARIYPRDFVQGRSPTFNPTVIRLRDDQLRIAPRLPAIERKADARIGGDDCTFTIRRIDPHLMVVVTVGMHSFRRPSAVERLGWNDRHEKDVFRIFWIDGKLSEVVRTLIEHMLLAHQAPADATVVAAPENAALRLDQSINAPGIAWCKLHADSSHESPRKARSGKTHPMRAGIVRSEDAVFSASARQHPRTSLHRPRSGDHVRRIRGRDRYR